MAGSTTESLGRGRQLRAPRAWLSTDTSLPRGKHGLLSSDTTASIVVRPQARRQGQQQCQAMLSANGGLGVASDLTAQNSDAHAYLQL